MVRKFVRNYIERHRHPINQLLHAVGVPLTFIVSTTTLILGEPLLAACCFVAGYVLQFIGHAIEGNDAGETILVKKWLGRPYTEFGPRQQAKSAEQQQTNRAA